METITVYLLNKHYSLSGIELAAVGIVHNSGTCSEEWLLCGNISLEKNLSTLSFMESSYKY